MAIALSIPLAEAALFTAGCALIHARRQRPHQTTLVLMGLAALLVAALAIAAVPPNYAAMDLDRAAEDLRIGNVTE